MRIQSKAVLLHFSSGIHSPFFTPWGFRSRAFRPVGIKVYFRALPAEDPQVQADIMANYLIWGLASLSAIAIACSVLVVICMRGRYQQIAMQTSAAALPLRVQRWKRIIFCLGSGGDSKQVNNYEEINHVRPPVPPRSLASKFTESTGVPTLRTSSQRTSSQRSCSGISVHSSPTSRQYMQIVCSSAGHCQYIRNDEIGRRLSLRSSEYSSGIYRSESSV